MSTVLSFMEAARQYANNSIDLLSDLLNSCIKAYVEHKSCFILLLFAECVERACFFLHSLVSIIVFLSSFCHHSVGLGYLLGIPTFFWTDGTKSVRMSSAPWKRDVLVCLFAYAGKGKVGRRLSAALSHRGKSAACVKFFWPVKKWFDSLGVKKNKTTTNK